MQDAISKYKMAAQICNLATAQIVGLCLPGASIVDLCNFGDLLLSEQVDIAS
jgi:methionine aminopeptidase